MTNEEILKKIREMSASEKRNLSHEELIVVMSGMTPKEIIELSNIVGYPVFTRLCMGEQLKHKFVLLQDGAAAIIVNKKGEILLQSRSDNDLWGLPGGCQDLGEKFTDTVIREVKEETNLDVAEEDLELIDIVSGLCRMHSYPNGDVVINNTALYCIRHYSGEIKWDAESKDLRFFSLDKLPQNQLDADLIERYMLYETMSTNNLGR